MAAITWGVVEVVLLLDVLQLVLEHVDVGEVLDDAFVEIGGELVGELRHRPHLT